MKTSLKPFYESLENISLINQNLDEKREMLKDEISKFNSKIQSVSINSDLKSQNAELYELLENSVNAIKEFSLGQVNNLNSIIEKEKFRDEFKNKFIIIIYGKFKAGKSFLGNFIAKNHLENQNAHFFQYDEGGNREHIPKLEEVEENGFATKITECTTSIQGFKLGSLAWIDTPGLGSITGKNGQLARDYIQSADYIIFPTSSDSVLQKDEKDSLEELFSQNKQVSIVITKSDDTYEDEDENGELVRVPINKSKENRKGQEESANATVSAILKGKNRSSLLGDILSISTLTAKNGLKENDRELFEGSNIPEFYRTVTEVIKTKASNLKKEAPLNRLKSFIKNDILKVISTNMQPNFKKLNSEIGVNTKELEKKISNIQSDIRFIIESVISKYSSQIDQSNLQSMLMTIDGEIESEVRKAVEQSIAELFQNFSFALQDFQKSNLEQFKIEDNFEEISYEVSYETSSGLRKFMNTVTFGLVERTYSSETITKEVKVGDNKLEVIKNFKNSRLDLHIKSTESIYSDLQNSFFQPLQSKSEEMKTLLNEFENRVQKVINI